MNKWLIYSLLSLLFCTGLVLSMKFLCMKKVPSEVILFYTMFFAMLIFGYKYINIIILGFKFEHFYYFLVLIFCGICSYFANNFNVKAVALAPNPSYANAISDMRLIPVAILSVFLFSSNLSLKGIFGIVLCFVGGFLISL